jgi:hypothetical protein
VAVVTVSVARTREMRLRSRRVMAQRPPHSTPNVVLVVLMLRSRGDSGGLKNRAFRCLRRVTISLLETNHSPPFRSDTPDYTVIRNRVKGHICAGQRYYGPCFGAYRMEWIRTKHGSHGCPYSPYGSHSV